MSCTLAKCLRLECCKSDKDCCTEGASVESMKSLLNKMRRNSIKLSYYHNARYDRYRNFLFYLFRLPILILSGINGFFAVGLEGYVFRRTVSILNAVISFVCGIITSIEISLNLQKRMESELDSYKKFYKLTVELDKELTLYVDKDDNSRARLREFTEKKYNEYQGIVSLSNIVTNETMIGEDEFEQLYVGDEDKITIYNRKVLQAIRKDVKNILPEWLWSCCCKKEKCPDRPQEYEDRLKNYETEITNHLELEKVKKEAELLEEILLDKENKKLEAAKKLTNDIIKNKKKKIEPQECCLQNCCSQDCCSISCLEGGMCMAYEDGFDKTDPENSL